MALPVPLVIRRSLTNWNFILQTAFALVSLGYAYALFARWPAVATYDGRDYALGGVLVAGGGSLFIFLTLRAFFDRMPLLQIDSAGIRSSEIGNLPVPWHEIGGCYFDKVSEGRNSYWYFFFTQTDAATGLKYNFKIFADEFDQENDDVLALIEAFKAADRSQPRAKPRPPSIATSLTGDMFVLRYSTAKELRAIGIYLLIAVFAITFATYIDVTSNDRFFSFRQFVWDPWGALHHMNDWIRYFAIVVFVLFVFGSMFRLRDIFFRKIALQADREGLMAADLDGETLPWTQIAELSFGPYDTLKVTDMSAGHQVDRFASLRALTFSPQEIYDALCWLLARYKVKFSQPWDSQPSEVAPPAVRR